MTEGAYHRQARELHGRLYEWVEVDGVSWRQVAERLAMPEWQLAKVRLAAQDLRLAVKEHPSGRVRWRPPA